MTPVLEVKDLTAQFEERKDYGAPGKVLTAVDHVNFQLFPGENLGIVGESGSGKSTIARVLTRLTDAASGRIFLHGEDITRVRGRKQREIYRKIQMIFQSPAASFDPRRTLGDGVGEALKNSGMSRREAGEEVKALLRQCGLPADYAGRYPNEVSGGECQRAAVARALAVRPEILICDEATSALDVTVQKQVVELLGTLQKQYGISCIFISHDLPLVQNFCSRVLVLREGKIVEEGPADEVLLNPRDEYTRELVDAVL